MFPWDFRIDSQGDKWVYLRYNLAYCIIGYFLKRTFFLEQVHNTIKSLSIVVSRLGEEKIKVHRTPKLIDGGFGLSEQAPCFLS